MDVWSPYKYSNTFQYNKRQKREHQNKAIKVRNKNTVSQFTELPKLVESPTATVMSEGDEEK